MRVWVCHILALVPSRDYMENPTTSSSISESLYVSMSKQKKRERWISGGDAFHVGVHSHNS